jgi:hypothetical protein
LLDEKNDPEPVPFLVLTDLDPGGPKTYGSGSATLLQQEERDLHSAIMTQGKRCGGVWRGAVGRWGVSRMGRQRGYRRVHIGYRYPRDEIGGVYLPSQPERTLQLCT